MDKDLHLYLWDGILKNYATGMAFALAHNAQEARELIVCKDNPTDILIYRQWRESSPEERDNLWAPYYRLYEDLENEPRIIDGPFGYYIEGGE